MNALEYGWWERKRGNTLIPPYLGDDPRNVVLTMDELKAYDAVLTEWETVIARERLIVARNVKARETGKLPYWEHQDVRCTTFIDVFSFKLVWKRVELKYVQFLLMVTSRVAKEKKERDDAKLS